MQIQARDARHLTSEGRYIKVDGELECLHRAVDQTTCNNGTPDMVPQDKGGDKIAASNRAGKTGRVDRVHLAKYFNDVVNDDHRADDRVTVPRSVVNPLRLTRKMFGDDYSMYMICKAQPHRQGVDMMSYADYFYALIGSVHPD